MLETASMYGLKFNWKKSQFLKNSIEYLGHMIENGMKPSPKKISAVTHFAKPRSRWKNKSRVSWNSPDFQKIIHDYARLAHLLSELLKKDVPFRFGIEEKATFNQLKEKKRKLSTNPVLKIFDQIIKRR